MKAIDTNILVYARREELPKHSEALALLYELAEGDIPWGVPIFCVGEFLRVVTHRRLFNPPTPLAEAIGAINAILESPTVRLLLPGQRFWPLFERAARQAQVTGNLVFDAQIVALCLEHGVDTLISEDRDFARFEGFTVVPIQRSTINYVPYIR